ncbi:hypothetical protein Poli38472_012698 [Pythium oligandrum]|uniref:TKL/LISK/LISK-DD1 protein kinase n=1 Tax=Pythium oligandrum TaxID=41045 RepID=A0A8K1CDX7_PYTOL|nr:hypothetical protein Poli38472_012698 [Pythium oligandrum]|eukprot:TMW61507.1 hypothetical protein Poli38472_012698 [Pythium oligandrum]
MSANQRGPENADASAACLFAIDPTAIKIGKEIGKGAFSVVYRGEYNKKHVAVKCQPKDEQGNIPQFVLKEVQILQKLQHPNILEFIGAADYYKTRQVLILSEHSNNGDLDQLLQSIRKGSVTHLGWLKMVQIALDVAAGIAFLHAHEIIHRDIKSSNILLDEHYRAKLCDFGFATEMSAWNETKPDGTTISVRRKSYCGTDAYMAPEMFLDEDYNENVDVFSFGVVLMEIICCRRANQDDFLMRLPQYKFQVRDEEFHGAMPASCPPQLARLAEQCVAFEPKDRPTCAQVVTALQEILTSKQTTMSENSETVELRPFTPREPEIFECEPQMDEEDDYEEEEEDDDEETTQRTDCCACGDRVPVSPPSYFSGVLLKRNRRGTRGWSEKVFILDRDQLHYTEVSPKNHHTSSSGSDTTSTGPRRRMSISQAPTMSTLALKDCRIWKTMEMPELCFNILNGNWKIKRELRAVNRDDLERWMKLINQAIDYANDQAETRASPAAVAPLTIRTPPGSNKAPAMTPRKPAYNGRGSRGSRERQRNHSREKSKGSEERRPEAVVSTKDQEPYEDPSDEVYQWLQTIGLGEHTSTLKSKGFASLDFIRETGIETDDLNFLGIEDPVAGEALMAAARTLRGED